MNHFLTSVLVRGKQVWVVFDSSGLTIPGGRLQVFDNVDEAMKVHGSIDKYWPKHGSVDLEFAREWTKILEKTSDIEVLDKLAEIDGLYMNILVLYSEDRNVDIPINVKNELKLNRDATFSGKRDALSKLGNYLHQQLVLKMAIEKSIDTDKLLKGWGGGIRNEWTQAELNQIATELAIELEFIENILDQNGA